MTVVKRRQTSDMAILKGGQTSNCYLEQPAMAMVKRGQTSNHYLEQPAMAVVKRGQTSNHSLEQPAMAMVERGQTSNHCLEQPAIAVVKRGHTSDRHLQCSVTTVSPKQLWALPVQGPSPSWQAGVPSWTGAPGSAACLPAQEVGPVPLGTGELAAAHTREEPTSY